jgi:hypothetical protein
MDEPLDRSAPATKGDVTDVEDRLRADMKGLEDRLRADMKVREDRLIEVLRDNETKLLKAFYSFAQSNQTRMAEIETETSAIKGRLATVEERLLLLERKVNFPEHPLD